MKDLFFKYLTDEQFELSTWLDDCFLDCFN